ncbi:type VI secretion system-associated FHA domain protein TagH [Duganella sp. LX20W]|uniref:Type VI secretion system-associated FHA domain protein TagH n=1 Tax=Rugamonas brunnea TaxID=2758569 RepID=A0A7W2ICP8_9BURK|nr:type VI secretion system-associated FHA domain protein TagH [Rugamonas brunnea]MBA5638460.1 type VI secretion system-associated FHA domain protein TagH [Rugamonas brunnea]
MPLTLRIQTYQKQAPALPVARTFDRLGGTIGRAAGNDLELPDPGKYISRNHSKVDYVDGHFVLTDMGSNPTWVNDAPVGLGKSVRLRQGDVLLIGDYVLVAEVDESAPPAIPVFQPETSDALPFQAQPAAPGARAPAFGDEPWHDTLAGARILEATGSFDPIVAPSADDPLGLNIQHGGRSRAANLPASAFRGSEPDHVAPQFVPMPGVMVPAPAPVAAPAAPVPPPVALIPEDFDPLASFVPPRVAVETETVYAPPPVVVPAAPMALAPAPVTVQVQVPMQEAVEVHVHVQAPPMAVDPVSNTLSASVEPAPAATAPLLMPVEAQPVYAAPAPIAATAPTHAQAPTQAPTPAAFAPADPVAASTAPAGADQQVLQALLRGLGVPDITPSRAAAETAELVGAMLREAMSGTMAVLLARAMTKRESRLEVTVLGAQANNPLKFFPDADMALTQMLAGSVGGYMPPVKAVASAFDDLKSHELAVIAGMRAALAGVLARFDPARVEATMEPAGVMDKMMSASRKARMWDRMVEQYGAITREADDDFQRLFGDKFAAAYEEQIARLQHKN